MTTRGKAKDKQDAEILMRQMEALKLRISGSSYRKIGEILGVSHEQIRRDVDGELKRLADENQGKAEELRQLELERLDKITDHLDNWLMSGNVPAINAYLKAMERRAKLLGLDAPEKKDVTSGEKLEIVIRNANG